MTTPDTGGVGEPSGKSPAQIAGEIAATMVAAAPAAEQPEG